MFCFLRTRKTIKFIVVDTLQTKRVNNNKDFFFVLLIIETYNTTQTELQQNVHIDISYSMSAKILVAQ